MLNKHLRRYLGILQFIGIIMVSVITGCGPHDIENNQEIIYEIVDVQLSLLEGQPQQLEIKVSGNVISTGWTLATLVPTEYTVPPADGIYEYTFYATPPEEQPAATVISPIEISHVLETVPDDLVGIRVLSQTNDMQSMLVVPKPQPTPIPEVINEITKLQIAIVQGTRAQLEITAEGVVASTGWSDPKLIPYTYIQPPQDGIYDFTFYATPPNGPIATVMTPIKITHILNAMPTDLVGIRVHSVSNNVVAEINVSMPPPNPEVINEITKVQLTMLRSLPPKLVINVAGTVNSAGWTKDVLVAHQYITAPQDGIYEFTYYATPPAQPSTTVITPSSLTHTMDPMPEDLLGVRIVSASNQIETLLAVEIPNPDVVLVRELTDLQLSILESAPPQLAINVSGNVSSTGWTSPILVPFEYILPPADGIYDFSFLATPPTDPSLTVITPIDISHHLLTIPDNLKGIRIHSETNELVAMINPQTPTPVPEIIYAISDVQVSKVLNFPDQLELHVKGIVSSSGWSKPVLIPYNYFTPPQDGIYDYTFFASPPVGLALGVLSNIELRHQLGSVPVDMKGVRIHASTNNVEALFFEDPLQSPCEFVAGGHFETAELYEGGAAPGGIDTRYHWSIEFSTDGTFTHHYSDIGAAGNYVCDNTGFHLLDAAGNAYIPWEVSVDIQNQSINVPVAEGSDRFYYKIVPVLYVP